MKFLLIAIGGGLGAVARYSLTSMIQARPWSSGFMGTVIVNVLGCFAIGAFAQLFSGPWQVREELRLAVIIGLLGGFTTFSSYAFESFSLFESGERWAAVVNVLLSNSAGLLAAWGGFAFAARFVASQGS